MFVVVVERWNRKVGGGWIVGFFFLAVVGGCRLRSGEKGRLLGPGLCVFFFSFSSCCRSLWLWMVGQQWKGLLLLCCDGCYDDLVFFFSLVLLLLMLLPLLIGIDVVAVVDDNGEEIIYYFNV